MRFTLNDTVTWHVWRNGDLLQLTGRIVALVADRDRPYVVDVEGKLYQPLACQVRRVERREGVTA